MSPFSLRDETALQHSYDITKCAPRGNEECARNILAQVKVYYVQAISLRREELSTEHCMNKSSRKKTKFNEQMMLLPARVWQFVLVLSILLSAIGNSVSYAGKMAFMLFFCKSL